MNKRRRYKAKRRRRFDRQREEYIRRQRDEYLRIVAIEKAIGWDVLPGC